LGYPLGAIIDPRPPGHKKGKTIKKEKSYKRKRKATERVMFT